MIHRWSRGRSAGLLLATLVVFGGAGCGDASDVSRPDVLGQTFATKVVEICQHALNAKRSQGAFPYPDFNPTKPDVSKLPDIGAFESKTVAIYRTWLDEMQALGQPPKAREAWASLMDVLQAHVRIIVEQQAAAERSDGKTFTKGYYEGNNVQERMVAAAGAAGVPVCADAAAA
jgi:hypothetical protein